MTDFVAALRGASCEEFEKALYEEIRLTAATNCAPGTHGLSDNPDSSSYDLLQHTLFDDFERFITNDDSIKDDTSSDSTTGRLDCLEANLKELTPKGRTICAYRFRKFDLVFSCRECAVDPTCVFCQRCFMKSIHQDHNYEMHDSSGGGYCDCGDPEAWRSGPGCELHGGSNSYSCESNESSRSGFTGSNSLNTVDVYTEIQAEKCALKQRIDSLPTDLVYRINRLLRPLIRSSIACLIDLVQRKPCLTVEPLSQVSPNDPYIIPFGLQPENESKRTSTSEKTRVLSADELWLNNDKVLNEETEGAEWLWDIWPPPITHIPLFDQYADSTILGTEVCPRTAPTRRKSSDIEVAALDQLSRARQLHPRLFPPWPMRTASERTAAQQSFVLVLHNNEYHNHDQVIKTLRRVLDVTPQQATKHAALVDRFGRSVLQTQLTAGRACKLASSIMRISDHLSRRPIYCTFEHVDVYTMTTFFTLFLRWLTRLSDCVPSVRPVICHALLGFFPSPDDQLNNQSDAAVQASISLPVLYPGEMVQSDSWLAYMLKRHGSTWRAVRQEFLNIIMAVLLREPFYRRVAAIALTRSYTNILQSYVYDDHHLTDSLLDLTVQMYTVTSLARQLLEENNILVRLLSHLAKAVEVNSVPLPPYYVAPLPLEADGQTADGNGSSSSSSSPFHDRKNDIPNVSIWEENVLKQLNPSEWDQPFAALSESNSLENENLTSEARVLDWSSNNYNFDSASCLLNATKDLEFVLGSLTNLRPLSADPNGLGGWWNEAARVAFTDFVQLLIHVLTYVQDLDGMQRETRFHVEHSAQFLSGLIMLVKFNRVLSLTVQLASSDKLLFQSVLTLAHQAFHSRVGQPDKRFRVPPLYDLNRTGGMKPEARSPLAFHSLGVTAETYAYDVSTYRISVVQPLHRFLARMYAHGLQLGFTLPDLGLTDKSFANLLIERPLQVLTFCAQYDAKMWVRNGIAASQTISRLYFTLRDDLDCDLQLLQLVAASGLLPADEFIARLVHKFQLTDCFKSPSTAAVTIQGRMPTLEALLRILLNILTNRSSPSIGDYTDDYICIDEEHEGGSKEETKFVHPIRNCLLGEMMESKHALEVEKTIYALCEGAGTYSFLRSEFVKNQPLSCLLHPDNVGLKFTSQPNSSNPEPLLLSILDRLTTKSTVHGRTVFILKPEVMAYRFDRFYWHLSPERQIKAEKHVQQSLRKWLQTEKKDTDGINILPIPPPPPLPLYRFQPHLALGLLGIIRCTTFVRLLRTLLDLGINSRARTLCSDTALDLTLHLISVALYEDEMEGRLTGSFPFLDVVTRVPIQTETDEELERLALSQHWLHSKQSSITKESLVYFLDRNCLVDRLTQLLSHARYEDQTQLISWTLNRWKRVTQKYKEKLGIFQCDANSEKQSTTGEHRLTAPNSIRESEQSTSVAAQKKRETRAEQMEARRARIMARMSEMQRSCMNAHANVVDQEEIMDIDPVTDTESFVGDQIALGPKRSLIAVESILSSGPSLKTLTCSVCLEEVSQNESSRMVISAHVCPSSVLSSHATEWLSGPRIVDFVSRLLHAGMRESPLRPIPHTLTKRLTTDVDQVKEQRGAASATDSSEIHSQWAIRNERLDSFMASLATTSAAKKAGFAKGVQDSSACDDLFHKFIKSITAVSTTSDVTQSVANLTKRGRPADCWGFTLTHDGSSCDEGDDRAYDRWSPRPLIASRDPICEEGSFVSFCFHPLHASCKARHARQLNARFNRFVQRQMADSATFNFYCPICKTISNLDVPVLSSIPASLPSTWLRARLLMRAAPAPSDSTSSSAIYIGLSGWLDDLRRWLGLVPELSEQTSLTTSDERSLSSSDSNTSISVNHFRSWISNLESDPASVPPHSLLLFAQIADQIRESFTRTLNESAFDQQPLTSAMYLMFSCTNRIINSQLEPSVGSTDDLDQVLGMARSCEFARWFLQAPPEPPCVTLNLFTMVQRLASLSRPKSDRYRPPSNPGDVAQLQDYFAFAENQWFAVGTNEVTLPQQVAIPPEQFTFATIQTDNDEVLVSPPTPPPNLSFASSTHPAGCHSSSSATEPVPSNYIRLPPSESVPIHTAVENFSSALRIFHDHLRTIHSKLTNDNTCSNPLLAVDGNIRFVTLVDRLNQWARVLLSSAAQEWRNVRHTVAYTLVVSERTMRRDNPYLHFFNGGLSELCIQGLKHFIISSLTAHAKHAAVSRGCGRLCSRGRNGQQNRQDPTHSQCWPQLREDLTDWWWWNYCVPKVTDPVIEDHVFTSPTTSCHLNRPFSSVRRVAETATRVAVTRDARDLWRLLLPSLPSFPRVFPSPISTDTSHSNPSLMQPPANGKTEFWSGQPVSLIWEVDITFLFISLLHLRPGLEETGVVECLCARGLSSTTNNNDSNSNINANEANNDETNGKEPGAAVLGPLLFACDEGRPRQPIGDAHESHLVRLCYTALLVQALLSWDPAKQISVAPELDRLFQVEESESNARHHGWGSVQLLQVWHRLRSLANLLDNSESVLPDNLAENLGRHLRISSLPFLRIAAFVINQITDVPISSKLQAKEPSSTETVTADTVTEHALLLNYLGLPPGPSDLLVILSVNSPIDAHDMKHDTMDVGSTNTTAHESNSHHQLCSLSESLWLARLITSWCLMGRDASSRMLYHTILLSRPHSILNPPPSQDNAVQLDPSTTSPSWLPALLPSPNIRLPSLIPLPREFRTLMSLVMEFISNRHTHMYYGPRICLTCGYLTITGWHPFSARTHSGNSAHSRRMHAGYSMTLDIHHTRICLLSSHARRLTHWTSPYRDMFGEQHTAFEPNRNPLFLATEEYNQLNQLWMNHQLASNATMLSVAPLDDMFE